MTSKRYITLSIITEFIQKYFVFSAHVSYFNITMPMTRACHVKHVVSVSPKSIMS